MKILELVVGKHIPLKYRGVVSLLIEVKKLAQCDTSREESVSPCDSLSGIDG